MINKIAPDKIEAEPKREQVRTIGVSTEEIMSSPEFERGFEDARSGVPFDWRIGSWEYERGRLFGFIAPLSMPLRVDGRRLNPKAIALCDAAFDRKLIV